MKIELAKRAGAGIDTERFYECEGPLPQPQRQTSAMGTGTDVATSSAQVTLVKGDLRRTVQAREISNATVRNMKQNLGFAFVYNAIGVCEGIVASQQSEIARMKALLAQKKLARRRNFSHA